MQNRSLTEILLAAALIGGAIYFLFYTESGRQWLDRLQHTAANRMDKWLADLEEHLKKLELAETSSLFDDTAALEPLA